MPEIATDITRIVHVPGIRGGDAIIRGTRIPVWVVIIRMSQLPSIEAVAADFDGVTIADIAAAIDYHDQHRAEIDALLAEHEE